MDEFALIRRYFDRRRSTRGVLKGIGDDGAVLEVTSDTEQVQAIDTLVESVHFPSDISPGDLGYRAVAVNVSDIAAMGAAPRWMTLSLSLPCVDEAWLQRFATGLFEAADAFGVDLVGGDTTTGRDIVVTIAMTGEVHCGGAVLRSTATPGDTIYVSGTLGDAGAGLAQYLAGEREGYLVSRFLRPTPRLALGRSLSSLATAAIDISDGFVGDLTKLLSASGVGAEIDLDRLPVSDAMAKTYAEDEIRQFVLNAGDDYELCFTAASATVKSDTPISAIGRITADSELVATHRGNIVPIADSGYRHFE